MECVSFRFLLLLAALLTCLVTATSVFRNGMIEKNDEAKAVDHEEVMRVSKWQWGRRISAAEETSGQSRMSTSEKRLAPATVTNMYPKGSKSTRVLKSVKTSSDEKSSEPKTAFHASHVTEEVFSTIHRDYQAKARRRPPINNAVPSNIHQNSSP